MGGHSECQVRGLCLNMVSKLYMLSAALVGALALMGLCWQYSCDSDTRSVATCGPSHPDNWQWSSEALRCGAKRLGTADIRKGLAGRWIVVAGDSIARFFFASLLRLASSDGKPSREACCPLRPALHHLQQFNAC